MGHGRHVVLGQPYEVRQRVNPRPVRRTVELQVQMRGQRSPRIAAISYQIARFHRKILRRKPHVHPFGLFRILLPQHPFLQLRNESIQMAIHRDVAVRMRDVRRIAESVISHREPRHVAIAYRQHPFPNHPLGLYVNATMKVIGARLAETAGHQERNIHGRMIFRHLCRKRQGQHGGTSHDETFHCFQQALKLMSNPLTEWVNAPTEMKSTPHSA